MKKARISELKNRLSHFLRYVRRGQSVLVYDRDRAIARIEPIREPVSGQEGSAHVAELVRVGAMRSPSSSLPSDWLESKSALKGDLVAALLAERESGR
jgi:antitoxin (DNA-binding transcriptional repressor) of toxin-antitoxin stability system